MGGGKALNTNNGEEEERGEKMKNCNVPERTRGGRESD